MLRNAKPYSLLCMQPGPIERHPLKSELGGTNMLDPNSSAKIIRNFSMLITKITLDLKKQRTDQYIE